MSDQPRDPNQPDESGQSAEQQNPPGYQQGPPPGYQQGPPPPYQQGPPPGYQQPPPPYQQGPPPGYQPQPVSPTDERTWSILGHVGGIVIGFIAPLIIWLIYKDRSRFIDANAKEALNFQLVVLGATIISYILIVVFIGALLLPLVLLANIIFCILGAVAANRGEAYRYPVNIRMIK